MRTVSLAAVALPLMFISACGPRQAPGTDGPPVPPPSTTTATVLDYGKGVELRTGRDVAKLHGAPEDFKQYIAGAADATGAASDPNDKCAPRIFVDKIDEGFATGGVFDCGGAQLMWARRDGGIWRQIWGGQITPDCPTMKKYAVPTSIAGKTCWDVRVQKDVPYAG